LKICKTISELIVWRNESETHNIGFVPTMGALHQGHLSLVEESKKTCQKTVVSIFVNELQFSPKEDFNQYPRTLESDLGALKTLKVDVVFLPSKKEMYNEPFSVIVNEFKISQKLEGASRPDFFTGVTTIVSKLFNLVRPSHAFFGQKDVQQLFIIRRMVENLNYAIKIVGCKTVREKNGLAMSSRNQYLNSNEKDCASIIYRALQLGENMVKNHMKYSDVIKVMKEAFQEETIEEIEIDYLSIAETGNFDELSDDDDLGCVGFGNMDAAPQVVISCAVYLNKIRLIDNVVVNG
tara:strand:- start:8946 stop:9827 length:882 start_codon:yes stop_codon:yes gene_type:complete